MKANLLQTKEERIVRNLFFNILAIRLVTLILMIFPAAWRESEAINVRLFSALWALGSGTICATAVYGIIVEIRTRVSAFTYMGITTTRLDETPFLYLFFLLIGMALAVLSGIFTYACLIGAISGK